MCVRARVFECMCVPAVSAIEEFCNFWDSNRSNRCFLCFTFIRYERNYCERFLLPNIDWPMAYVSYWIVSLLSSWSFYVQCVECPQFAVVKRESKKSRFDNQYWMKLKLDFCTTFYYIQHFGYSMIQRGICNQAIWNASNYWIYAQFLVRQTNNFCPGYLWTCLWFYPKFDYCISNKICFRKSSFIIYDHWSMWFLLHFVWLPELRRWFVISINLLSP